MDRLELYGAVFYFDEQLDYVRCRSAGEAIPALRHFFQRPIPCVCRCRKGRSIRNGRLAVLTVVMLYAFL